MTHEYEGPSMPAFLAGKMAEETGEPLLGALLKVYFAIWWTDQKRAIVLHDERNEHEVIHARSLAVGLSPPNPSHIGAWVHMICTAGIPAKQVADREFIEYVRQAMGRRTLFDAQI